MRKKLFVYATVHVCTFVCFRTHLDCHILLLPAAVQLEGKRNQRRRGNSSTKTKKQKTDEGGTKQDEGGAKQDEGGTKQDEGGTKQDKGKCFYICRILEWEDGEVRKEEQRSRGTVGGQFNKQPVQKGDPLYRASYYKIDEADTSGLTFVDTGHISTISGLGFRHKLRGDSFSPKPKLGASSTRASTRAMSLLSGVGAGSAVPRWMQWKLDLDEKQQIAGNIRSNKGAVF